MVSPFRKETPFPAPRAQKISFDQFEADLRSGELRKGGTRIRLQAQPFQLLAMLLEHAGEVVTREEICRKLWPGDTFVDFDHSLAAAVNKIREALADSADSPRFVETLPKRGYRFIGVIRREQTVLTVAPEISPTLAIDLEGEHSTADLKTTAPATKNIWLGIGVSAVLGVALLGVLAIVMRRNAPPKNVKYTQLTNFSDAAFAPAISPDGRMIAFIRGNADSFPSTGQIYAKVLPNGEPFQLTHDLSPKYGVAFSPDGSKISYTAAGKPGWDTSTISVFGGESRLMLPNAAGLTWLDEQHVLFSEIKTGLHMGITTSTYDRSESREVYLPEHERGMAHWSYASPDRKWILVVEMGGTGDWQRCRLIPFDGSSKGSQVGPHGACRSAAWSPDGKWMYFSALVNGSSHLWRQRFPEGEPEQITSGPTEEEGVAITPDGRAAVSSVGINESGIWLHDASGEHLVSAEGSASHPLFSRNGHLVYYLLSRESAQAPQELWATDLASGKSAPIVEGFPIESYDVSSDGKRVVFATVPANSKMQIWLASCDRAFPPRMLTSSGENSPYFGPGEDVVFSMSDGKNNHLFRMKEDGSGQRKVTEIPIIHVLGTSPDGRWALALMSTNREPASATAMVAISTEDGEVREICPTICFMANWSPDGSRFYVEPVVQGNHGGMTIALPVPKGKSLPDLPASGFRSTEQFATFPGSTVVDLSRFDQAGQSVEPGVVLDTYIYAKIAVHRNLFEIPLP